MDTPSEDLSTGKMPRTGLLIALVVIIGFVAWSNRERGENLIGKLGVGGGTGEVPPENSFVGSRACAECHQQIAADYSRHPMARSLRPVGTAEVIEKFDTDRRRFTGGQRTYHVERRDGELIHHEVMFDDDGGVLYDQAETVQFAIGAGVKGRSYLLQRGGLLFESPITWYRRIDGWDMSPGYDDPRQEGFTRPVDQGCLVCHAGQSRSLDGSVHRMEVSEMTISCERCHGPGSRHVDKRNAEIGRSSNANSGIDYTIVNPADLDRELSDSICAQCHLGALAIVQERGRALSDFRPGLPLDAFRNAYRLDAPNGEMTVVGHVDQLRLSSCYQASEMSCVTCHDPHNMPTAENRLEYYQAVCASCHQQQGCSVAPEVLQQEQPDNDCVACHMPKSSTDLPHMNFHHHRVGLHDDLQDRPNELSEPGRLVAMFAAAPHTDLELQRSLGIAYIALSQREVGRTHGRHYVEQGVELLKKAWEAGLRDPEMAKNLAEVALMNRELQDLPEYLEYLLAQDDLNGKYRVSALLIAVTLELQQQKFAEAASLMREVTQLRYVANDWENLAQYELLAGNKEGTIKALRKALALDPTREHLRRLLAAQLPESTPEE